VAPTKETLWREVRCTAQLHDALCNLIRVNLFVLCVLEKLLGDALGMDPGRHKVMALVPENAHDLRGKGVVQDADDDIAVGSVSLRHRAVFDVLAGSLPQSPDVCQKWFVRHLCLLFPRM
jgi:hypothetical protein